MLPRFDFDFDVVASTLTPLLAISKQKFGVVRKKRDLYHDDAVAAGPEDATMLLLGPGGDFREPSSCGTMTRMTQRLTPSSTLRQVIIIS